MPQREPLYRFSNMLNCIQKLISRECSLHHRGVLCAAGSSQYFTLDQLQPLIFNLGGACCSSPNGIQVSGRGNGTPGKSGCCCPYNLCFRTLDIRRVEIPQPLSLFHLLNIYAAHLPHKATLSSLQIF